MCVCVCVCVYTHTHTHTHTHTMFSVVKAGRTPAAAVCPSLAVVTLDIENVYLYGWLIRTVVGVGRGVVYTVTSAST